MTNEPQSGFGVNVTDDDGYQTRVWALVGAYGPDVSELCAAGTALLPGIAGLGLSAGPARPVPASRFSSDQASARIESLQTTLDEGPCRDAAATGRPVLAGDLTAASWRMRWPDFAPGALQAGVRAVSAFPLHAGGVHHPGAVDLYRRTPGAWSAGACAEATAFTAALTELLTLEQLGLNLADAFTRARHHGGEQSGDLPASTAPGAETAVLLVRWFGWANVSPLRRQLSAVAAAHGLSGVESGRFVLAVHEAMTNVVCHGGGLGQLLLWRRAGQLWCQVSDHGPGIPSAAIAASHTDDGDITGSNGRGLRVIRQACTSLDITTDATGSRLLLGYQLTH